MKRFGYSAVFCVIVGAALLSCTSPLQPPTGASSKGVAQARDAGSDSDLEVSGVVTSITPDTPAVGNITFTVAGSSLSIVVLDPSILPAGFAVGMDVEVQGTIDPATGFLIASEVEVESDIRILGPAAAPVATGDTTVSVNGVTVSVNASTRFMDKTKKGNNPDRRPAALDAFVPPINTGDPLDIHAFLDTSTTPPTVVATSVFRLKKIPPSTLLEGPAVADVAAGTLSILGVPIDISGATFEDATGAVDAATFLAEIVNGVTIVEARGPHGAFLTPLDGSGMFVAAEVSLEGAEEAEGAED